MCSEDSYHRALYNHQLSSLCTILEVPLDKHWNCKKPDKKYELESVKTKIYFKVREFFPSTQRYYRRFLLCIIYLAATCFGRTTSQ
jgi:hypothetical protein